ALMSLAPPSRTAIYPLSLHDALPISRPGARAASSTHHLRQHRNRSIQRGRWLMDQSVEVQVLPDREFLHRVTMTLLGDSRYSRRSEEHTSELQSRENLVCRLLLEKKK